MWERNTVAGLPVSALHRPSSSLGAHVELCVSSKSILLILSLTPFLILVFDPLTLSSSSMHLVHGSSRSFQASRLLSCLIRLETLPFLHFIPPLFLLFYMLSRTLSLCMCIWQGWTRENETAERINGVLARCWRMIIFDVDMLSLSLSLSLSFSYSLLRCITHSVARNVCILYRGARLL